MSESSWLPWPIVAFFLGHWWLSVFFQSFFLHRYGAHRMFRMSKGWERFFHLCTYVTQGSSYLNPRGYAILHRMHHAYSDTPGDPHSPVVIPNPFKMMWRTAVVYHGIVRKQTAVEPRFEKDVVVWPWLDRFGNGWASSLAWGTAYTVFYLYFATAWWHFLLVPFHYLMGPVHGSIVNYFGHKLGYRNFSPEDDSRNTLVFDFLTMGELFQNNHHARAASANFAARWFELDPTWPVVWTLDKLGVLRLNESAKRERRAPGTPAAKPAQAGATSVSPALEGVSVH
jgi:stearoyl-CoA desaturase (delta-9 desaturase)